MFHVAFCAVTAAGLFAIILTHIYLASEKVLVAPPLTATNCIDDKFLFLRNADLEEVRVAAVGSSAAWRNLDMSYFANEAPSSAINAAPCYLHAHETAYFTDFLTRHTPNLEYLIAVFHPRDFEDCAPGDEAFFSARLASGYIDGWLPAWVPYLTGFRPRYLSREAQRIADVGTQYGLDVVEDRYGSSILKTSGSWRPRLSIDERCYDALPRLEAIARERGVRLVVATVPAMPSWKNQEDPGGSRIAQWTNEIRQRLDEKTTYFIDGTKMEVSDGDFADPVHFKYPSHSRFTSFIVDAINPNALTSLSN